MKSIPLIRYHHPGLGPVKSSPSVTDIYGGCWGCVAHGPTDIRGTRCVWWSDGVSDPPQCYHKEPGQACRGWIWRPDDTGAML